MPLPVGPSSRMFDFAELDVVGADARVDALVVVVDGDREDLLRAVLADHVVVEDRLDLRRLRDRGRAGVRLVLLDLFGDDVVAEPDALVADVDGGAGDELLHLLLRFAAEGAVQVAVLVVVPSAFQCWPRVVSPPIPYASRHSDIPTAGRVAAELPPLSRESLDPPLQRRKLAAVTAVLRRPQDLPQPRPHAPQRSRDGFSGSPFLRGGSTSSMRPYSLACTAPM